MLPQRLDPPGGYGKPGENTRLATDARSCRGLDPLGGYGKEWVRQLPPLLSDQVAATRPAWWVRKAQYTMCPTTVYADLQRLDPLGGYGKICSLALSWWCVCVATSRPA